MLTMQEEPSSLKKSYKFIRRPDITLPLRMKLGSLLFCFNYHGQVTKYSKKYNVSRGFLYSLKAMMGQQLSMIYGELDKPSSWKTNQHKSWEELLKLRLIGKCSLSAISELLGLNHPTLPNSTCFISQFLKQLGDKLGKMVDWKGLVHYASDEVFMIGHQPVLVTVDPISTTILRIEHLDSLTRKGWENHWQALKDQGVYPLSLVKDDGVVMNAAQQSAVMSDVKGQLDTFHAVAHQLGIFTARLTKALDKAILEELDQHDKLQRAVSPSNITKRTALYQQACEQTLIATQQLESFQFLYFCLGDQFNIFDHQGQARQQETAIEEAKLALKLMETLGVAQLNDAVEKIEKKVDRLFDFLPKAQIVQYQLVAELGEIATFFWIYAWQNDKKSRKIKKYAKSKVFLQKSETALLLLQEHYSLSVTAFQVLKTKIFNRLDSIVQSSAIVETINSILRPYMNEARNQLSNQQLNVIRFYLNHRVYKRGKRKGYAPIELLRGKKLEQSWLELLLAKAA